MLRGMQSAHTHIHTTKKKIPCVMALIECVTFLYVKTLKYYGLDCVLYTSLLLRWLLTEIESSSAKVLNEM